MTDALDTYTAALLEAARRAGAEAADAMAVEGTAINIDVRHGTLEQAERSEGVEIGVRVLIGRRQACVAASATSAETIAEMAERAVAMAREAPEDEGVGLADAGQLATGWDIAALEIDDPADEPAAATLQDDARRAEAAALANAAVSTVDSAGAGYSRRRIHIAASNGFAGGYARTGRWLSCVAITGTGTGMERDWFADSRQWQADLDDPETVGRRAAERAAARTGARKPPTGRFPVVYDERVASSLTGHLLAAINGASIVRGSSWLREALGAPVLPDGLDLTEEPHRPRGPSSRPFDAEGLPTRARTIVERGRLTGWTLDLASARRLGMAPTGNAARGPSGPPSPSTSNTALTQGTQSRAGLLADMGTGLLITSLIGASINPTTGNYSRGASGHWVENGEIAYPVNECTVAGNLREMLRTLRPANDARAWAGAVVPSLLVEGLTLAGA